MNKKNIILIIFIMFIIFVFMCSISLIGYILLNQKSTDNSIPNEEQKFDNDIPYPDPEPIEPEIEEPGNVDTFGDNTNPTPNPTTKPTTCNQVVGGLPCSK